MKYILNIFLITLISFGSFAQESDTGVDHEIGTWQFRQIDPGDVANFLSNEDKVYRKFVRNAIDDGRMKHWGLLRKVSGNTSNGHNFFFYNGFEEFEDMDNSPWGSGSTFGLKPVKSNGVLGTAYTSPATSLSGKVGNYIVINTANPSDVNAFIRLQSEVWKPFIENYINDENSTWAGWEVHRVVSPTGNGFSWSVATVDHFTTLSGALNSFPNGANWPEGLQEINDLLPNGKFTSSVIYEVMYYEGPDPAVSK